MFVKENPERKKKKEKEKKKRKFTLEFPIIFALKLPSFGLVVFIDIKTTSVKTFLKEHYAIALSSCYAFTKKITNME